MEKDRILDNVDQYTPAQLVDFIHRGIVSLEELILDTEGKFTPSKRRQVMTMLDEMQNPFNGAPHDDELPPLDLEGNVEITGIDDGWNNVDKRNIEELRDFVSMYPNSRHITEANRLINSILLEEINSVDIDYFVKHIRKIETMSITMEQKNNQIVDFIRRNLHENKISKIDFLNKLNEDHNLLSAGVVRRLIEDGVISISDLLNIGIDKVFIQKMINQEGLATFATPEPLEKINKQSTEIYFWGIPSSGKSCAIGALLSVAENGTVARTLVPDTGSQGYGYMTRLMNLFHKDEIGNLMTGTDINAFYEMGFDLIDNENRIHPITLVDMAGELMRCMYKANAGEPMNDIELEMLETMTNVLIDNRSRNRKIHFFVIEYGAEDRNYEGLPQKVYLEGALSYIKNTGLFETDTDAIYIMITKADKIKNPSRNVINDYINQYYGGFFNGLEIICANNEINKGKVDRIAFSLGDVCFQNYCRFNSYPAEQIVRLLLSRTACYRGGRRGKFESLFRS